MSRGSFYQASLAFQSIPPYDFVCIYYFYLFVFHCVVFFYGKRLNLNFNFNLIHFAWKCHFACVIFSLDARLFSYYMFKRNDSTLSCTFQVHVNIYYIFMLDYSGALTISFHTNTALLRENLMDKGAYMDVQGGMRVHNSDPIAQAAACQAIMGLCSYK